MASYHRPRWDGLTLYLSSLRSADEQSLRAVFEAYGTVRHVIPGSRQGSAMLVFAEGGQAARAIASLDGTTVPSLADSRLYIREGFVPLSRRPLLQLTPSAASSHHLSIDRRWEEPRREHRHQHQHQSRDRSRSRSPATSRHPRRESAPLPASPRAHTSLSRARQRSRTNSCSRSRSLSRPRSRARSRSASGSGSSRRADSHSPCLGTLSQPRYAIPWQSRAVAEQTVEDASRDAARRIESATTPHAVANMPSATSSSAASSQSRSASATLLSTSSRRVPAIDAEHAAASSAATAAAGNGAVSTDAPLQQRTALSRPVAAVASSAVASLPSALAATLPALRDAHANFHAAAAASIAILRQRQSSASNSSSSSSLISTLEHAVGQSDAALRAVMDMCRQEQAAATHAAARANALRLSAQAEQAAAALRVAQQQADEATRLAADANEQALAAQAELDALVPASGSSTHAPSVSLPFPELILGTMPPNGSPSRIVNALTTRAGCSTPMGSSALAPASATALHASVPAPTRMIDAPTPSSQPLVAVPATMQQNSLVLHPNARAIATDPTAAAALVESALTTAAAHLPPATMSPGTLVAVPIINAASPPAIAAAAPFPSVPSLVSQAPVAMEVDSLMLASAAPLPAPSPADANVDHPQVPVLSTIVAELRAVPVIPLSARPGLVLSHSGAKIIHSESAAAASPSHDTRVNTMDSLLTVAAAAAAAASGSSHIPSDWLQSLDGAADAFPCGSTSPSGCQRSAEAVQQQRHEACCYLALRVKGIGHQVRVHFKGYPARYNEWRSAKELRKWDAASVDAFIRDHKQATTTPSRSSGGHASDASAEVLASPSPRPTRKRAATSSSEHHLAASADANTNMLAMGVESAESASKKLKTALPVVVALASSQQVPDREPLAVCVTGAIQRGALENSKSDLGGRAPGEEAAAASGDA